MTDATTSPPATAARLLHWASKRALLLIFVVLHDGRAGHLGPADP